MWNADVDLAATRDKAVGPRNDALANAMEEDAQRLRAELGIAPGQTAVLYAPTSRPVRSGKCRFTRPGRSTLPSAPPTMASAVPARMSPAVLTPSWMNAGSTSDQTWVPMQSAAVPAAFFEVERVTDGRGCGKPGMLRVTARVDLGPAR